MNFFLSGKRNCGLLAHFTSLASPYGIGDIGYASYGFLNFLDQANQTFWQFLPTGPTHSVFSHSPYMSSSAFAGSPLLLCPRLIHEMDLLSVTEIEPGEEFSPYYTDFERVTRFKNNLLQLAFLRFDKSSTDFNDFRESTSWLNDYALFQTIKEIHNDLPWYQWPEALKTRSTAELDVFTQQYKDRISYYAFEQYLFNKQWTLLKEKAGKKGIKLFGDIPIYVGLDSSDVWANQPIFTLNPQTGRPTHVAGVPPDYFSKTGQRWGNPLYKWQTTDSTIKKQLLDWWVSRFKAIFTQVDTARIDHFRGFDSYWAIPEAEETAINGKWLKGPGKPFFDYIFKQLGSLEIVAEDLGIITEDVNRLKESLHFPGMKVLQFAFDSNKDNTFLPHNFTDANSVIYTGTHDNDTTLGWFLGEQLNDSDRSQIKRYVNGALNDLKPIHKDLIHLALSSISSLAIIPLQDVLGFGSDCRMNTPGIAEDNWRWRCAEEFLSEDVACWMRDTTGLFGRGRENKKS